MGKILYFGPCSLRCPVGKIVYFDAAAVHATANATANNGETDDVMGSDSRPNCVAVADGGDLEAGAHG